MAPGLFQSSFVVLARERCLFERMDAAVGLKKAAAIAAARLHAETGAPYQRSGALITHKGNVFGIWWWDAQWVGEKLGGAGLDPNSRILPEPMARAASVDGWRVAKASTGYEAQVWSNGILVADQWRRKAFDNEAWGDFVRVQSDRNGAPELTPMTQDPPFTLQSPYRRTQLSDWTPERSMQAIMAGAAVVLVSVGLWMFGQAVGFNKAADAAQVEVERMKALAPATANVQGQVSGLTALKAATGGADPMVMLENAQQIIKPFDHKILAFTAERNKVRIYLPQEAADDLGILSQELMESPYFASIKPTLDRKKGRLILDLIPKGAKADKAKPVVRAS